MGFGEFPVGVVPQIAEELAQVHRTPQLSMLFDEAAPYRFHFFG